MEQATAPLGKEERKAELGRFLTALPTHSLHITPVIKFGSQR